MALNSTVGKILDTQSKIHVEWEIPNYFSLSQKTDSFHESPSFYFLSNEWCIRMYPNGSRLHSNVGFIDLYLFMRYPVPSFSVTIKFGIKILEKEIVTSPIKFTFDEISPVYVQPNICERNYLLQLMREHPFLDTLVIYCDATAEAHTRDTASQTSLDSINILSHGFLDLLQSGRKSDISVNVCGHVFKVHKLILETRSPVFAAMFEHNMREDKIVKIPDCDPDAFHDFLQYLYTGKFEEFSFENIVNLFSIADKYCVKDLKEKCVDYMDEYLSTDNVCDVFVIADRHNELQLRMFAKDFLIDRMVIIKTTEKWGSFVAQNPLLAVEILMEFVPDEESSTEEDSWYGEKTYLNLENN